MPDETWVVAANSSKARIFRRASLTVLEELDSLVHAESRLQEGDLVADRKGRAFDRVGGGRHALEQQLAPHKREAIEFAVAVARHLKECWKDGLFKRLYLAAGPTFLGFLRQELDPHVQQVVAGEIDKDLTQLTPTKICEHLP